MWSFFDLFFLDGGFFLLGRQFFLDDLNLLGFDDLGLNLLLHLSLLFLLLGRLHPLPSLYLLAHSRDFYTSKTRFLKIDNLWFDLWFDLWLYCGLYIFDFGLDWKIITNDGWRIFNIISVFLIEVKIGLSLCGGFNFFWSFDFHITEERASFICEFLFIGRLLLKNYIPDFGYFDIYIW